MERDSVFSSSSHKCPQCAGKLIFDTEDQLLTCEFCGNKIKPEKLELLPFIRDIDKEDADEKEDDKCEIVCDNCGGSLITDKDTSATFCTFCGSPAIISRRLKKQFRPDYIIPFKVSRETAVETLKEFARKSKYVPSDFFNRKNFDKVTGIYVPFWLMSSRCSVSVRGAGYKNRIGFRDKYTLMSDFDVAYDNIPFDGALEISDELMEAIEPFDISEAKPFKTSYLQGFFSQKFNLTADNLTDRILVRLEEYGKETAGMAFGNYDSVKFGACVAKPYDLEQKYALFPVWFLNYNYNGGSYRLVVNGQTGKVDGFLPVSNVKRQLRLLPHRLTDLLICLLLMAPLVAVAVLILRFLNFLGDGAAILVAAVILGVSGPLTWYSLEKQVMGLEDNSAGIMLKPLGKLWVARRASMDKLKDETNMMVGKRPVANVYYDTKAKIDYKNSEMFACAESIITGNEL